MSYNKEIQFRDYSIVFEYYCDNSNSLELTNWTAYEGDSEALISCPEESEFIERYILNWLDKEWYSNGCNYIEEIQISNAMKRYDKAF